jgi:hypothetical protein
MEEIKVKIKIFFYLILICFTRHKYLSLFLNNVNIYHFKQSIFKYPILDKIKLNYSSKCSELFKYNKNNNRDLVMFAYNSSKIDVNSERSLSIYNVLDSIKKNIPKAKIICFVPNNSKISLVIQALQKNNVSIIKERDFLNLSLVSSRFLYELRYLKKYINYYDRIIHADLTDIFFLSDIFETLKPNELIMNKESGNNSFFGEKGNFLLNHSLNSFWFNRSFGYNETLFNFLKRIDPIIINAGLIMGDSKEYLKFLEIVKNNLNYSKASDYGYDQMLINVLFYTGKFESINIKFDLCTQRSCFMPNLIFNKEDKKLSFEDGCSPVVIHKSYPSN